MNGLLTVTDCKSMLRVYAVDLDDCFICCDMYFIYSKLVTYSLSVRVIYRVVLSSFYFSVIIWLYVLSIFCLSIFILLLSCPLLFAALWQIKTYK